MNMPYMYMKPQPKLPFWIIPAVIVFVLFIAVLAHAEEININALANAIYKAENSKTHPYGILAHYKTTTPRQACINTIKHALRDWDGKGDFIAFLGSRYCPVGCDNDRGTNRFWIKNVHYFLAKEK